MTVRFFLWPVETNGASRGPKYLPWRYDPDPPALLNVPWSPLDFGLEPTALIAADVDAAQLATIAAQLDITVIPSNLDLQVGANLATVQASLELLNIPGDFVTAGNTYRQVLRGLIAIFSVAQRFNGLGNGRLFPAGITLATTLGAVSVSVRQQLQEAAEAKDYDYSGLTLSSTLRDVLKKLASQQAPGAMLGVTI